jgi:hypothetical protein
MMTAHWNFHKARRENKLVFFATLRLCETKVFRFEGGGPETPKRCRRSHSQNFIIFWNHCFD